MLACDAYMGGIAVFSMLICFFVLVLALHTTRKINITSGYTGETSEMKPELPLLGSMSHVTTPYAPTDNRTVLIHNLLIT